jgi:hypothetical protein
VWDVWFHGQIVYSKIEHLSNIDEIMVSFQAKDAKLGKLFTKNQHTYSNEIIVFLEL